MKKRMILALLCALVFLSGCSYTQMNIDAVITPPKFSDQQSAIYAALKSALGNVNIELRYPDAGEYRSAFVVRNIDDEPSEEAIVFYQEKSATAESLTGGLKINILDQDQKGEWKSVCNITGDVPTEGAQALFSGVNEILFWEDHDTSNIYVIIGFQGIANSENLLRIYQYQDGEFVSLFASNYQMMRLYDLDSDEEEDLFYIAPDTVVEEQEEGREDSAGLASQADPIEKKSQPASGNLVCLEDGAPVWIDGILLDPDVTEYRSIATGQTADGVGAIFLDGYSGERKAPYSTQILTCADRKLDNLATSDPNAYAQTFRTRRVYCTDYDADGYVEIPSAQPARGYEEAEADQQLYYTRWSVYQQGGFRLKSVSYVNAADGYMFLLPEDWAEQASVKYYSDPDAFSSELLFFEYQGTVENTAKPLLSIKKVRRGEAQDKAQQDGYHGIQIKGQALFMEKQFSDTKSDLKAGIPSDQAWTDSFILI